MILELEETLMFVDSVSHNWFALPKGKDGGYWKKGASGLPFSGGSSQLPATCKGKAKIWEMGQSLGPGTDDDGSIRQSFIFVLVQRLLDAVSHSLCIDLRCMGGIV